MSCGQLLIQLNPPPPSVVLCHSQKNKELMNDIISNSKLKNGFGTSVASPLNAISPTKRPQSPDHPNPALPITEVSLVNHSQKQSSQMSDRQPASESDKGLTSFIVFHHSQSTSPAMLKMGWALRTLLVADNSSCLKDRKVRTYVRGYMNHINIPSPQTEAGVANKLNGNPNF